MKVMKKIEGENVGHFPAEGRTGALRLDHFLIPEAAAGHCSLS
jgi:hypothetical protein